MDVSLNNRTMEEYIKKLQIFSKQLLSEGKKDITDFLEKVIKSENKTLELLDFIYKYVDELNEDLVLIFNYLLECNAQLGWFSVASFIEEETGDIKAYYELIKKCIENGVELEKVQSQAYENCGFEEMNTYINNLLSRNIVKSSGEEKSLEHYMEENRKLRLDINKLSRELDFCESELSSEKAYSDKINKDIENLKSQCKRLELKNSVLEKKNLQIEESFLQMQNVNEFIEEEKRKLEDVISQLHEKIATIESVCQGYETKLKEKDIKLDEYEELLSAYREQISSLEEEVSVLQKLPMEPAVFVEEQPTEIDMYEVPKIYSIDEIQQSMFTDTEEDLELEALDEGDDYEIGSDIFKNAIEIKDNSKVVVKHTGIFAKVFRWYQKEKFLKKSEQDQKNLIFIEMMRRNFPKELVEVIKKTLISNSNVSKFDLYALISRNATREEILNLCNG